MREIEPRFHGARYMEFLIARKKLTTQNMNSCNIYVNKPTESIVSQST